jgi:uncharacterized protein (DUF2235 family)
MKRIVTCFDGTWNTSDTWRRQSRPTNVSRLARCIRPTADDGTTQVVHYVDGVGTSGSRKDRVIDGMIGAGMGVHVRRAYRFLVENFDEGDDLFVFGFSRGGYAAMTFVGLLRSAGILRRDCAHRLSDAYALYHLHQAPYEREATEFRMDHSHEPQVKCLGLWDTVGGPGHWHLSSLLPWRDSPALFDRRLTSMVDCTFHALAMNEYRSAFRPVLYDNVRNDFQRLEQVWFAGAHSDVGGGTVSGLSDISLAWMAGRAAECGLETDPRLLSATLDSGIPNTITNSRVSPYLVLPRAERAIGRCRSEAVHASVPDVFREQPTRFPRDTERLLATLPHAR